MINCRKIIGGMINGLLRPLNLVRSIRGGSMDIDKIRSNVSQTQLYLHYQLLRNMKLPLPKFEDTGFSVYSQNDEDGLLLYIFSLIGSTNKMCVDVGAGSPYGGNTANLILNWGWGGAINRRK